MILVTSPWPAAGGELYCTVHKQPPAQAGHRGAKVGRRRRYSVEAAICAAKDAFWKFGYDGAAVSDLETATGLSRSSLYQAFGCKRQLFARALDAYIAGFIDPLLGPLESASAGATSVECFVTTLQQLFRGGGEPSRYGCLWANSIAGAGRDGLSAADVRANEYWDRLDAAFSNGLQHARLEPAGVTPLAVRAHLLAAWTYASWLLVPIDAGRALGVCDGMLAEVQFWRQSTAAARR